MLRRGSHPRLPPGQTETRDWPVLHYGPVPRYPDLKGWTFRVFGLVENPFTLTWDELMQLPKQVLRDVDIHCVTHWSKLGMEWEGIPFRVIYELARVRPEARYVMCHSEYGFTANVPLEDCLREGVLLAYKAGGEPLTPEHGYPLRFFVPHLYFWKSAKWLRGLEFMERDRPGFWEQNGYHMRGDPWKEQRYWDDP